MCTVIKLDLPVLQFSSLTVSPGKDSKQLVDSLCPQTTPISNEIRGSSFSSLVQEGQLIGRGSQDETDRL